MSVLKRLGDLLLRYGAERLLYRETELDDTTMSTVAAWLEACCRRVTSWGDEIVVRRVLDEDNLPTAAWAEKPARGRLYVWGRWPVLLYQRREDNRRDTYMLRTLVGGPRQSDVVRAAFAHSTLGGPDRAFKVVRVGNTKYDDDTQMEEDGAPADRSSWYAGSPATESLRRDVQFWLGNMAWYHARGFPWRLGAMLHGPPGSGKTSLVRAVAQEFRVPLFILSCKSLERTADWTRFWSEAAVHARPPVFVLIEDFDLQLRHDTTESAEAETSNPGDASPLKPTRSNLSHNLSALLNLMDGVSTPDGVMFFVTTNHPEAVAPAAIRRGRIDVRLYVGPMDAEQRRHVAKRALLGFPEEVVERVVGEGEGEVAVDFRERCRQLAVAAELVAGAAH